MQELIISTEAKELHDDIGKQVHAVKKSLAKLGELLDRMKTNKFYKQLGYDTFDDYCQIAFGFKRRNAYRLINASKTLQNVSNWTQNELPNTEGQLRELSKAPEEEQAKVWEETQNKTNKNQPTAKEIKETMVSEKTEKRKPLINKEGEIITHYELYDMIHNLMTKGNLKRPESYKIINNKTNINMRTIKNTYAIFNCGKDYIKEGINNLDIPLRKVVDLGSEYYKDENLFKKIDTNIKKIDTNREAFKNGESILIHEDFFNKTREFNNFVKRLKASRGRIINVKEYNNIKNPYKDPLITEKQNYYAYVNSWIPNNPSKLNHIKNLENMIFVDKYENIKYSIGSYLLTLVKK